jgi:6-phosphogluconate dehydrogenase
MAKFGMVGTGVMAQNLALNIEEHGFPVAVWNRTASEAKKFVAAHAGKQFTACETLKDFVAALERPRRIMLLIKAGAPVDAVLEQLKPLLEPGDIVIEGGNSWYKDTQRREADLTKAGLNFFGVGVSGGEEGARRGPSLMPGGNKQAYEALRPIFEAIAAKTDSGACVTYVGPNGAGHFVKMVHNGIEYADMQLIAEAYDILRRGAAMSAGELADVFAQWNRGPLESFLIEISAKVLAVKDPETKQPLVDLVLDKAGQKGTGKWTAQVALDVGIPIPSISAAIDGRVLSSMKDERVSASKKLSGPAEPTQPGDRQKLIQAVHQALYASKICAYAQGMSLIAAVSKAENWDIDLRSMARIWKGGCIIRARFLDSIMRAYERRPDLPNLLLDDEFGNAVAQAQPHWRQVVGLAAKTGVPVLAFGASLSYFDSYRSASLPQNLTQAQRDAFGAHTFERTDHPDRGFTHFDWLGLEGK